MCIQRYTYHCKLNDKENYINASNTRVSDFVKYSRAKLVEKNNCSSSIPGLILYSYTSDKISIDRLNRAKYLII